jgi:putative ABC transport system permease protein
MAPVLAGTGLYCLLRYTFRRRMRELAIRVALGASLHHLRRRVLSYACRLLAGGVLLGVTASLMGSRWASSRLYGISAVEPWMLISVMIVLGVAVFAASVDPIRRVSRLDAAAMLARDI